MREYIYNILFLQGAATVMLFVAIAAIIAFTGISPIPGIMWLGITVFSSLTVYEFFNIIFHRKLAPYLWINTKFFLSVFTLSSLIMILREIQIVSGYIPLLNLLVLVVAFIYYWKQLIL